MKLTVDLVLAAQVAVPCIIVLAKTGDRATRILAGLCLLAAIAAACGPVLQGRGIRIDFAAVGWIAAALLAIPVAIRAALPIPATLIVAGSVLGCLIELGLVAR